MDLVSLVESSSCSLYESPSKSRVRRFIVSTPESRSICNDPLVLGVRYTELLRHACEKCLDALREHEVLTATESECMVLHILRGGLNFGIREALARALKWNRHTSAFVSAQRARVATSDDWIITENEYKKLSFHGKSTILFGDVVATGTSLRYALKEIIQSAKQANSQIESILFFTIGGPRSHEILEELETELLTENPSYRGSAVVYFEGIFNVAEPNTPVAIKIDGTDLLRRDAILAPEFIDSQYMDPCFPLERCAVYDAGSRAFDVPEYLEDVIEYWQQTLDLTPETSFNQLLAERYPELDAARFGDIDLEVLCREHLNRLRGLL